MDDIDLLENLAAIEALEIIEEDATEYPRQVNCNKNPFEEIIMTYRLSKDLMKQVINMVSPYIEPPATSRGITIERKVLTAIRFFASGSYQNDIGVSRYSALSQASVSNCIREVTSALNNQQIFDKYVYFPRNLDEFNAVRKGFNEKFGFQGVVGVVDCTHIAIFPPPINGELYPEHIYVNRKGYHSINTQLICDVNLRILNVCAKYPGSSHDSHIWNQSNVKKLMETLHRNGHSSYMLLGDSGYALRPWMMTPFLRPEPNTPEATYNDSFCKVRSIIERCNGVLKMRFRCLLKHRVLHYHPHKASSIINSCVLLHNLCVNENIPIIDEFEEDCDFGFIEQNNADIDVNIRQNPELTAGRRVRQQIVERFYT
ncbi:putative nuclease HARBI1 [Aphis gossypii]|uniref:putative nuclease HARBI1 n=1 Tax=Aphis gossypii TaxID=80765 RepID=UPI0021599A36|nr:putative nuclease HARBI1 [Aphis gossypii]